MKAVSEFILILPLGFHLKSSQSYFSICIQFTYLEMRLALRSMHGGLHILQVACACTVCSGKKYLLPPPPPNWATRPYITTGKLLNGLSALAVLFVNKISEIHYDLPATILLYPTFTNRARQIRSLLFKSAKQIKHSRVRDLPAWSPAASRALFL